MVDYSLLSPLSWIQPGSELGKGVSVGTGVGSCSPSQRNQRTWLMGMGGVGAVGQVLRKMDRKPGL